MTKLKLLIVFLTIHFAMPAYSFEYTFEGQTLNYKVLDDMFNTCSVAPSQDITGDVIIPTSVVFNNTTYTVTNIGWAAFWDCKDMSSVSIPNSVNEIGDCAFHGCSGLTSLLIPASVTYICESAFHGCEKLISIDVESGNPSYSSCNGVLFNSNMSELVHYPEGLCGDYSIPISVVFISQWAFRDCKKLTSLYIPDCVDDIAEYSFEDCI